VQTNSAMCTYGGSFGVGARAGTAFPVASARVHDNYSWRSKAVPGSAVCTGTPCVVNTGPTPAMARYFPRSFFFPNYPMTLTSWLICRVDSRSALLSSRSGSNGPSRGGGTTEAYTYVDEAYISSLQKDCHWSRDNGIIELIPIAVVEQVVDE
jgi:hypothetical protein